MSDDGGVGRYLVECYWPGVTDDDVLAAARRADGAIAAIAAIAALSPPAGNVRLLRSILVPEDETVFCLFEGAEADVRRVSEQAAIPFERILEWREIEGRVAPSR